MPKAARLKFHGLMRKEDEGMLVRKTVDPKVPCPSCSKLFHPNALSQHVRSQHIGTNNSNEISTQRHLRSVCVDQVNGIYLVRKSFSGGDYVIHVQFKTSPPQCFTCSDNSCKQLHETAARSNNTSFMCKHLKSVHFFVSQVNHLQLWRRPLSYALYMK